MVYNPSLREEPREKPASVIPIQRAASILDWLEGTGRLRARQSNEQEPPSTQSDAEIDDLMGSEDASFDEPDDEDDVMDPED